MQSNFHQNGKWTFTRLPDGKWQLEEQFQHEDQLGASILSSNLGPEDLLALRNAADAALGNAPCAKCDFWHPSDGPHHPLFDRWMRSLADHDNLIRRNKLDMQQSQYDISKKLLTDFLLTVDNIRAVIAGSQFRNPYEDFVDLSKDEVGLIQSSIDDLLQKTEVVPLFPGMRPVAEYNPEHHQAVEMSEDAVEATTVVPLMQGYLWKDKLLRVAQVRIVTPKAKI
jgi:molecular chaperone GrpE (heat shock protein)